MEPKILGIDPGKQGAFAIVGEGGKLLDYSRTPLIGKAYNEHAIKNLIEDAVWFHKITYAVIEALVPMPGLASNALVSMGTGHGFWRMALIAAGLGYEIVRSQDWQAGIGGRKDSKGKTLKSALLKKVLIAEAVRRWPDIQQHSGICDAALIAEYQRRKIVGGGPF